MSLQQIAWTLIALETLVFLAWLYSLIFPSSGADAAGRGLGQVFAIGLGIYILITLALMLFKTRFCTIVAIVLASLPLLVTVFGLVRWLKTR